MRRVDTEILVIGSGAGGAVTAAKLAAAGRDVTVVEEGPWIDPDAMEPFSLEEMQTKYRHRPSIALGNPVIAYAEGRCVGGSTEINSALYHRLPPDLAAEWARRYRIDEFTADVLDHYGDEIERELSVTKLPGAPPVSSAVLERGATKMGWRAVEFDRMFAYDGDGRGTKQTMTRTFIPHAVGHGARVMAECRVVRLLRQGVRVIGARCRQRENDGREHDVTVLADHVFVCGGAIQTPALLQRSGIRARIGSGLKLHPTIKIAARFPHPLDHGDVPMHRVTEFAPNLTIGGSITRRGHAALALAEAGVPAGDALEQWEHLGVYYTAIRSDAVGTVLAVPGLRAPLVTYRLTDADMSRLARGLIHLGEVLLAAGATELYPSVTGGPMVRRADELGAWWDATSRRRANLMTVHMTSTVRIGEDRYATGADSFGRVWGYENLRVNDASLVPDAPGVNPQATIMALTARNVAQFLSQ